MKVLVTQILKDYKGEDVKDSQDKPLSLKDAIFTALNEFTKEEMPTPIELKNKCFQISLKVSLKDEVDLTLPERTFIIERIGIVFISPIVLGRVTEIFEGADEPKTPVTPVSN